MALLEDHVHICTTIEFSSIRIGDQLRSTVLYQITTSDKQTITACTYNDRQTRQTGQTKLTFELDFPANLYWAAFAILAMFSLIVADS